jgi:ABC-type antimicrobial peptide transport system permease subunit
MSSSASYVKIRRSPFNRQPSPNCGVRSRKNRSAHLTVAQRTHEFGVRIALRASDRQLLGHVLGDGMRLPAQGVSFGLAVAWGLTRVLDHLLFQVSATDPLTFAGVAVLLPLVAFAACWIPARRASRVDPIVALRGD